MWYFFQNMWYFSWKHAITYCTLLYPAGQYFFSGAHFFAEGSDGGGEEKPNILALVEQTVFSLINSLICLYSYAVSCFAWGTRFSLLLEYACRHHALCKFSAFLVHLFGIVKHAPKCLPCSYLIWPGKGKLDQRKLHLIPIYSILFFSSSRHPILRQSFHQQRRQILYVQSYVLHLFFVLFTVNIHCNHSTILKCFYIVMKGA